MIFKEKILIDIIFYTLIIKVILFLRLLKLEIILISINSTNENQISANNLNSEDI